MISKKTKKYLAWFLMVLAAAYLIKEAFGNGDFKVFLEAAKLIANGENPYGEWIFVSEGNYSEYFYSPLWALLLIPFSYIPNFIPNLIWLSANAYFLYRVILLVKDHFNVLKLTHRQIQWVLILSALMSFRFVFYNFGMIQMTIFLLWGILESVRLSDKDHFIKAGLLLGLIINIKVLPLVIVPYLIYRKAFKTVSISIIFTILFLYLPAIFIGWSFNQSLLAGWWEVINPANSEHLIETAFGAHSLTALIPTLLTKTEGTLPYSRQILSLDMSHVFLITNGIRLFLVILTLYFIKWPPFKIAKSQIHRFWELSYILLLIPLIFPRQQKYAFFLLLPAQIYLSVFLVYSYPIRKKFMSNLKWISIIILTTLSFALMTLTTDGLIGRDLNRITQHYKLITYGALCLIPALILCSSSLLERIKDS